MSRLDFVIFGATGFTGKKAVEETLRITKKYGPLTWGIAGRSQVKLDKLKEDLSKKTGDDLTSVEVIIADVQNLQSLKNMCSKANVVINCCGPYRFYGEPVVKAAIDCKCNYVDVSGEPQFMETMQLEYDKMARDVGVYIISGCGFDSIPNDMGVVFMEQMFDGVLNSVESYLSSSIPVEWQSEAVRSGIVHYGTWESLVYGLSHHRELPALRKKLYPEKLPTFKPKLTRRMFGKRCGGYCLPFPGADESVVYRTQRYRYEHDQKRPVQFRAYVKFSSCMTTLLTALAAVFVYIMCSFNILRPLLLKYPRFFSFGTVTRNGPKEEVMNNTHFEMELHGEGWGKDADVNSTKPNKNIVAKVKGVNPGYGATVTALVFAAFTILKESDAMPSTGGVLTPGAAFAKTHIIKNLHENNLTFEIVESAASS